MCSTWRQAFVNLSLTGNTINQQTEVMSQHFQNSFLKYVKLAVAAKLLQSCPTLCAPIDGSPPGSPIPGIFQARTLAWVAISPWHSLFLSVKICVLRISPTSRLIQYVVFFPTSFTQNVLKVQPCYISMLISMFIRACISISFLFIAKQQPVLWIHHRLFIHSLVDGHLGRFHLFAIVNRAAAEHSCTSFC